MADSAAQGRALLLAGRCATCEARLQPADDQHWERCECGRSYRIDLDQTPPGITERFPTQGTESHRVECAPGLRVLTIAGDVVELERDGLGLASVPIDAVAYECDW